MQLQVLFERQFPSCLWRDFSATTDVGHALGLEMAEGQLVKRRNLLAERKMTTLGETLAKEGLALDTAKCLTLSDSDCLSSDS